MVAEGSVLVRRRAARRAPRRDVAPDGFPTRSTAPASRLPFPFPGGRCRVRYRVTCLTPLLVGDGSRLSPIDYMVWKDQVNVLDQRRIFRLLAKGPRLDGYLAQLKSADKLDFASWGGFAQNFADRRIPFEHSSCAAHWERCRGREPAHPDLRRRSPRAVSARQRAARRACGRAWSSRG